MASTSTYTSTIAITGKGDKTRYIPLHPILQLLATKMPPPDWWFPSWVGNCQYAAGGPVLGNSVSACVSKAMDRAGVPGKPHSLRHWFGSTPKESGVDSLVIKELMGHESLATTAIYVRVPLRMQCSAVNLLPDVRELTSPGSFAALPRMWGPLLWGRPAMARPREPDARIPRLQLPRSRKTSLIQARAFSR